MVDPDHAGAGGPPFAGPGEMARRMRTFPWEKTSLGDPSTWPSALRAACDICLASRFPIIVLWGEDLRFVYNDAYVPLLGDKHPALGTPGEELWGEIWHIVGPMLRSVVETGESIWVEDMMLPVNRHGFLEETYWTYSYGPLCDDGGTIRGVFTTVNDTTERVVGERRMALLRELGARAGTARGVEDACRLVAGVLDRAGRDIPHAAIHLRAPDGGPDPEPAAVRPTGTAPLPLPEGPGGWPLEEVLRTGRAVVVEDVRERFGHLPDGGWPVPPERAVLLPLSGETGAEPLGVMVLVTTAGRPLDDGYRTFLELVARQTAALINGAVAYRVQQQRVEELAELDRAKTLFFSNVSHEFRTPLTLISGPLAEMRARAADLPADLREDLEVMHRNALRLGKLVNTLLDFSRLEAGRMRARFEPVDLAGLTADLAGVFRSAMERAGLTYEVHCPPLPRAVCVDRDMWEKIVLNLLGNALKFTLEGSVVVRLSAEEDRAVLRVSDTGTGVAADEIPRLFERFHRIENARSRSNEGSGIGLALVRELVTLHGGTITAGSVEGEGTTFTVRLPFGTDHLPGDAVVEEGATARPAAARVAEKAAPYIGEAVHPLPERSVAAPRAAPGGGTPPGRSVVPGAPPVDTGVRRTPPPTFPPTASRVLIADDNGDMRDYLTGLLREEHRVTAVPDGLAALEAVRADPPDLVVSDVMMPRMDGLRLVAALRADPRTAGVPVLLLSARAGQEASIEGLEAGADDYLVKPFSAGELRARVRTNVELARLRNHHAHWRAALIDSLQEAFFVCDEEGAVIEINAAFTDLLGYGPGGLPYPPEHPWWPGTRRHPEEHRIAAETFARLRDGAEGHHETPVVHRDGHLLWVAVGFKEVRDPDTGRRLVVGTLRDITEERFTAQREAAMAALGIRLAEASGTEEALRVAMEELRDLWHARRIIAAHRDETGWVRRIASVPEQDPPTDGENPPVSPDRRGRDSGDGSPGGPLEKAVVGLYDTVPLRPVTTRDPTGVGITLDHPGGRLALWIEPAPHRPLGPEDTTLLAVLGGRLGQALHRVHTFEQHRETALGLQRAILGPDHLPDGFAVRYEPAARPLQVGGDWYDTVELPDGRIGIVVGDCVGRGLEAATVMGQLRSACRALLLESTGPARTLTALDRFAALVPGAICTTVFCGVLEPDTGRLVYSSAGHPPGILVRPDGGHDLLEGGRSTPLAVRPDHPRPEAERTLPPTSVLLLYTDGLVERRRHPLDVGIERAAAVVADHLDAPLQELADAVMRGLEPSPEEDGGAAAPFSGAGYRDDVAMLLYRHARPLEVTFPAESARLAGVRAALRAWLTELELERRSIQRILVVAGEACANAVEHGHRHTPGGAVRLTARATAREIHLTVADSGTWRVPRPDPGAHRGRGLRLIRGLAERVTVESDEDGTTVDAHVRIDR
ncbi:SpoIIE family protein phosphatase [Streptomyces calidiresistens]